MMAGRKPLPTHLKSVKGTNRKGRENKAEPKPDPSLPSPPDHLNKYALMEWGRLSELLYRLGLLTDIDRSALAICCQAYGRWVEAEQQLAHQALKNKEKGIFESALTIITSNGNIIQNPLVGIANKAAELHHKFLTEFGMTPSSRSRIVPKTPDREKENPFAGIGGR